MTPGDRSGWMWTRFHADPDDYRPVYRVEDGTPGLGPYWCSGYGDGYSIVCAWTRPGLDVRTYWPEASHVSQEGPMPLTFTDRFPEPEWWATDEEKDGQAGSEDERPGQHPGRIEAG